MFESSQYQLIDFGNGIKLEKFSDVLVRRPSPAAKHSQRRMKEWPRDVFQFELERSENESAKGAWDRSFALPEPWTVEHLGNQFLLKPTPFGHLGIFPEQADNWRWIRQQEIALDGMKALNLFAYTGGTTMALARAGCEVVHIDSARNIVNWARENARQSGLADAPIRWIVEDAMKFVEREIRRGSQYQIIVADPPSFGRGPKSETWKIQRDFTTLLECLGQLIHEQPVACLISCHTQEFGPFELEAMCGSDMKLPRGNCEAIEMKLSTSENRYLPAGSCFRWIHR